MGNILAMWDFLHATASRLVHTWEDAKDRGRRTFEELAHAVQVPDWHR